MSTKGVVITGGAGGVGYAYADEFMRLGHWVVICDVKDPAAAVEKLREKRTPLASFAHSSPNAS